MIYQYAIVDEESEEVIGKYVNTIKPFKMRNIEYTLKSPDGEILAHGKAFLSRTQRFWDEVKDPLFSAKLENNLVIEG
ncbi:hypothetical protein GAP32_502 [Cronobacter phage vB_CsaM_GAP32]|uniref:Uncharacterized protein n=1 Tax=Cronobacter phage vB_CsaM_GAP32 TaxID=1141136 RepID=K4F6Q4_9CAUD|nr:hypothetical protein GAP32_502 [Cronobacter phage vB_CsaM_GAP32]AFC21961.1 hypothetical protein GAP32_502 [Cronobacter phage vB_CsaM_GAP32]